ncbi:hypothetical protein ANOM_005603 [Aspergillus nomiae NRRL 13137]|uniref:Uncharacterized protein n=1 Tax=Aspergillus nomiae NRRL (strain ATCC 15546 / NRRL 13137 / CBS 260.88 / M93) TaxID=1509407 RepID=A0A0L1J472_ASPN3|nr:uncharacterized protein ANOM_005603 [Aspergillus nomiae NRRL 13137]KNG86238.1 hypothetical protein ANOM_005603 [Aspergillus nomiae NRRL 13137]
MRIQIIALFLGLSTAVLAVPHKPQNERRMWKNWQEPSITTVTPTPTPTPTPRPSPTTPPGDDDDSGEFPFPWPTEWPPIFDDFPDIGGNDDSSSSDVPDAKDKSTSGIPDVEGNKRLRKGTR